MDSQAPAKPNGLSQLETRHQCQSNWLHRNVVGGFHYRVNLVTTCTFTLLARFHGKLRLLSGYKLGWNSNLHTEQQWKLLSFAGSE